MKLHFLLALLLLETCHGKPPPSTGLSLPDEAGRVTEPSQKLAIYKSLQLRERWQIRTHERVTYYHPQSFLLRYNSTGHEIMMRYELLHRLGQGSYGVVYAARDHLSGGRKVAIKIFPIVDEMYEEAQILERCKSRDGVRSYCLQTGGCGIYRNFGYIVMPLLGPNLYQVRKTLPRSDWEIIRNITFQLATALQHIHQQGVVHNDLKPDNVLVVTENPFQLCVVDMSSSELETSRTKCRVTPGYEAPEIKFLQPHGRKADMWSLGCLLAEIQTGRALFPFSSHDKYIFAVSKLLKDTMPPDAVLRGNPGLLNNVNFMKECQFPFENVYTEWTMAIPPDLEHFETYLQFLDLLKRLIVWDPRARLDATQVLAHPFLQNRQSK